MEAKCGVCSGGNSAQSTAPHVEVGSFLLGNTAAAAATRSHLEHVERFELNGRLLVPQQLHDDLQIGLVADIAHHNAKVVTVKQELGQ